MKLPEAFGTTRRAQKLLRTEVQRAISLFPNDECQAICELLDFQQHSDLSVCFSSMVHL